MGNSFTKLNPKAKIFQELQLQQPKWWKLFSNDKELYIDIRKDNYINIYYYGGSLAKISYVNGFVAEIHQKYLGDKNPRRTTQEGKKIYEYDRINLSTITDIKISEIKNLIQSEYLRNIDNEKPAEKSIQGKIIKENSNYIDSEFQFNKDSEIGKLRIDLIELSDGILSFIELKVISDSRLRNDEIRNSKTPEIIEQMNKYKLFITKYESEILDHYNKLLKIKTSLGLTTKENIATLNKVPKLIIANTYKDMTTKKDKRISDIKMLLEKHTVNYEIIKWK